MARATKPICKGCGYKWAKNWQSFLYAIHHNILRLINILTFSQITQNIQNTFIPSFCPKLCYYCSILSPILLSESPTNQTWFIMIYTVNVLWDLPIHLTLSWFTIILLLPFPTILPEEYTLNFLHGINSVQSLSCVQHFATPWTAACQPSLSIINSQSLLKLMHIESVMPSNHLILCHPLLLLPSVFPSIRVFSNESVLHIRWPKYCSFSFSISPSNEYSGLISFRIDWSLCCPGDSQQSSSTP